jgi:hypothetical protein
MMLGAGTGLVYILRWYWWRIKAWSEVSAMGAAPGDLRWYYACSSTRRGQKDSRSISF